MPPVLLLAAVLGCLPGGESVPRKANAAAGLLPARHRVEGHPRLLTDGNRPPEGTLASGASSVTLRASGSSVTLDLQRTVPLAALLIQGDATSAFRAVASTDGESWRPVLQAAALPGRRGLASRGALFGVPVPARYLRVVSASAAPAVLSEIEVFDSAPAPWPPVLAVLRESAPRPRHLSKQTLLLLKLGLAVLGTAVLVWERIARAPSRPRTAIFAACGLLGLLAWGNYGAFHSGKLVHVWDFLHYYLGAKYFPETRYTTLYASMVAAEAEIDGGAAKVSSRRIRNLETGLLTWGSQAVADSARLKARFAPARWEAFKHDVAYFRARAEPDVWEQSMLDHGYNGTPVWAIAGSLLANLAPASDRQVRFLALIDPALLLVMWGVAAATFGWRAAAVAALYFGTNHPGQYEWIGGSFLRYDWLAFLVIGLCFLAKGRSRLGGFALAVAALLRVFPAAAFVGLAAAGIAGLARKPSGRRSRLPRSVVGAAAGALLAALLLVPVSIFTAGRGRLDTRAWPEFVENSRKYYGGVSANFVGLKVALSWVNVYPTIRLTDDDPARGWWELTRQKHRERLWLGVLLSAAAAFAVWKACASAEPWVAALLGLALIPFLWSLSCYYYAFPLVFALLWKRLPRVGVALVALAGLTCLAALLGPWDFQIFAIESAFFVLFGLWLMLEVGRASSTNAASA